MPKGFFLNALLFCCCAGCFSESSANPPPNDSPLFPSESIVCDKLSGLDISLECSRLGENNEVVVVVTAIPSGNEITRSQRQIHQLSVRKLGYQIPTSSILEKASDQDFLIKVDVLAGKFDNRPVGMRCMETRFFQLKELR